MVLRKRREEQQPRPCLFRLHEECQVWQLVGKQLEEEGVKWGSEKFVKLYCGLCIKAVYARAHLEKAQGVKVVNTL